MAKVKVEVKHLPPIDAASIFAVLEERSAQIKELEREIENLRAAVAHHESGKRAMTVTNESRIEALTKQIQDYRELWEKETAKTMQLSNLIATMDTKAVHNVEQRLGNQLAGKDNTIATLKEDLYRCLGWIAAQGAYEHPAVHHIRPHDRRGFERPKQPTQPVYNVNEAREMDEEVSF